MVNSFDYTAPANADKYDRHVYMVLSEVITVIIYAISIVFLPEYFGECCRTLFLHFPCCLSYHRSCVRYISAFRLESSGHRGSQLPSLIHHQTHSE